MKHDLLFDTKLNGFELKGAEDREKLLVNATELDDKYKKLVKDGALKEEDYQDDYWFNKYNSIHNKLLKKEQTV